MLEQSALIRHVERASIRRTLQPPHPPAPLMSFPMALARSRATTSDDAAVAVNNHGSSRAEGLMLSQPAERSLRCLKPTALGRAADEERGTQRIKTSLIRLFDPTKYERGSTFCQRPLPGVRRSLGVISPRAQPLRPGGAAASQRNRRCDFSTGPMTCRRLGAAWKQAGSFGGGG
jgi:hypothetical protein